MSAVVILFCTAEYCLRNTKKAARYKNEFTTTSNMKTFHDFKVNDINGKPFDLSSLKGKKIMVVNTASECGYTPQYDALQKLYEKYSSKNFTIIGFPCNDFGGQEPGNEGEIAAFCKKNYGVTFPMMSKVKITGDSPSEIYEWLLKKSLNGVEDSEVKWNFFKYLIDENGKYVKLFSSKTLPNDAEIIKWIEK